MLKREHFKRRAARRITKPTTAPEVGGSPRDGSESPMKWFHAGLWALCSLAPLAFMAVSLLMNDDAGSFCADTTSESKDD